MKKLFVQLDLFGKPVLINFLGNEKSKSVTGATFSLLFFAFVVWAVTEVGSDIVCKQSPKTTVSESLMADPEPMILSPDTFNMAFGLADPYTYAHFINESIYSAEAILRRRERRIDENGTIQFFSQDIPIELERCTKEHFGYESAKFETIELDQLYCIKKEQPALDQIRIQGVFESLVFEYVGIGIKKCDSRTSKVTCAPEEIIEMMLKGSFALYYPNVAIDTTSFSQPNVVYRDSYYTSASPSLIKNIPVFLNHIKLISDLGWITQMKETKHYIRVGNVRESTAYEPNSPYLITLQMRVDKILTTYDRSYIKVQDIFAAASGLVTTALLFMAILLTPYSKIKFYEGLINELFAVKRLQKQKSSKKQEKAKTFLQNQTKTKNATEKTQGTVRENEEILRIRRLNIVSHGLDSEKDTKDNKTDSNKKFINSPCFSQSSSSRLNLYVNSSKDRNEGKNQEIKALAENKSANPATESKKLIPIKKKSLLDLSVASINSSLKSQISSNKQHIIENSGEFTPAKSLDVLEHSSMDKQNKKPTGSTDMDHNAAITNKELITFSRTRNPSTKTINPQMSQNGETLLKDEENFQEKINNFRSHFSRDPEKIHISFVEHLCSFFWKTKALKEKLDLLDKGAKLIEERFDIFNIMNKLREVDKLKFLLLGNEQLVLFDALPKPELCLKDSQIDQYPKSSFRQPNFAPKRLQKDLLIVSYEKLRKKMEKTIIDSRIIEICEDITN